MYKQQGNLVVRLNKDRKYSYFSNSTLERSEDHSGMLANFVLRAVYFSMVC